MKRLLLLPLVSSFLLLSSQAGAASLLIVQGPGGGGFGGYGDPSWSTYTDVFDLKFGVANITLTADLSNAAQVDAHSAVLIELRGSADVLGPAEIANLTAFIASGRRVAMFGENAGWQTWDASLLSVVGGTYGGEVPIQGPSGDFVNYEIPVSSFYHPLTAGMTSIYQMHGSVALGGTALFDFANIGTLWGGSLNVLTYLSFNEFFSGGDASQDVFNQNIADWLYQSTAVTNVPEPGTWVLVVTGLGAAVLRRHLGRRNPAEHAGVVD